MEVLPGSDIGQIYIYIYIVFTEHPLRSCCNIYHHSVTWHSQGESVVKTTWFGGDKKIAKDTNRDEEGEKDDRRNGQTDQSADAATAGEQEDLMIDLYT